jgi:hypothetical protein
MALCFLALKLTSYNPRRLTAPQAPLPAGRAAAAALPDPRLTPGAIDPAVTQQNIASTICVAGYTRSVRPTFQVSNSLKHQVMSLYHSPNSIHDYELDHLIPLELGGCPSCIANLWPQPWTTPGAHEKDDVELYLHDRVCHRLITLQKAQHLISTNWYSVYLAINR